MPMPKGFKHSEETKKKMRLSKSGKNNPFYGKKHTKITKQKMSNVKTGVKLSENHKKNISESGMGRAPWNKGKKASKETIEKMKKYIASDITKTKISLALKGKNTGPLTEAHKDNIRKNAHRQIGIDNKNWKGDSASYYAIHQWVRRWYGAPKICEYCNKDNLTGRYIDWANKSGNYKRIRSDWIRLCKSCHKNYDLGKIKI